MARIARFYGWSHDEVNRLSIRVFNQYYKAITHLEAEELLNECMVGDYPHLKKKERSKIHGKLNSMVYQEDVPVMTMDQFARKLVDGK